MSRKTLHLQRILKGVANHRRLEIIFLLSKESELSVLDIAERLNTNLFTISDHIRKLSISGIVMKRSDGNFVRHALTERGKSILEFCKILE